MVVMVVLHDRPERQASGQRADLRRILVRLPGSDRRSAVIFRRYPSDPRESLRADLAGGRRDRRIAGPCWLSDPFVLVRYSIDGAGADTALHLRGAAIPETRLQSRLFGDELKLRAEDIRPRGDVPASIVRWAGMLATGEELAAESDPRWATQPPLGAPGTFDDPDESDEPRPVPAGARGAGPSPLPVAPGRDPAWYDSPLPDWPAREVTCDRGRHPLTLADVRRAHTGWPSYGQWVSEQSAPYECRFPPAARLCHRLLAVGYDATARQMDADTRAGWRWRRRVAYWHPVHDAGTPPPRPLFAPGDRVEVLPDRPGDPPRVGVVVHIAPGLRGTAADSPFADGNQLAYEVDTEDGTPLGDCPEDELTPLDEARQRMPFSS